MKKPTGKKIAVLDPRERRALAIERAIKFLTAAAAQERSIFGMRGPSEWHTENFIQRELSLLPAKPTSEYLKTIGADDETFDREVDALVTEAVRATRLEAEFVAAYLGRAGLRKGRVPWSEEIQMETELVELRGQLLDASSSSERDRLQLLIAEKKAAKDNRTRWPHEFKTQREMRKSLKNRLAYKSPTAVRKALAEEGRFGSMNTVIDLAKRTGLIPAKKRMRRKTKK